MPWNMGPPSCTLARAPSSLEDLCAQLDCSGACRINCQRRDHGLPGGIVIAGLQLRLARFGETKQGHFAIARIAQRKLIFLECLTTPLVRQKYARCCSGNTLFGAGSRRMLRNAAKLRRSGRRKTMRSPRVVPATCQAGPTPLWRARIRSRHFASTRDNARSSRRAR